MLHWHASEWIWCCSVAALTGIAIMQRLVRARVLLLTADSAMLCCCRYQSRYGSEPLEVQQPSSPTSSLRHRDRAGSLSATNPGASTSRKQVRCSARCGSLQCGGMCARCATLQCVRIRCTLPMLFHVTTQEKIDYASMDPEAAAYVKAQQTLYQKLHGPGPPPGAIKAQRQKPGTYFGSGERAKINEMHL
jgi:hypothetical protein